MRKKIVAGNWKMNKNLQEGIQLAVALNEVLSKESNSCRVIIGTPFIHLAPVSERIDKKKLGLAAQNCADHVSGAYTGEVSAEMVKSTEQNMSFWVIPNVELITVKLWKCSKLKFVLP